MTMDWNAFAVGLLPEHFLLGGVLLLILHSIAARDGRGRGAALIALVAVCGAALAARPQ